MHTNRVRDAILIGVEVTASIGAVYMVWRLVASKDTERTITMYTMDRVRTYANKKTTYWQKVARDADTLYWNQTLT